MSYENLGSITKKVKSGRKNVLAHSYIIKQIIDATKRNKKSTIPWWSPVMFSGIQKCPYIGFTSPCDIDH